MDKQIKAVIFDLDGVIVSTDEYHYRAWAQIAREEGLKFNREINNRLRGVSRMDCVDILLADEAQTCSEQRKQKIAQNKNRLFIDSLDALSEKDALAGVPQVFADLKSCGILLAIGSSSKNAPKILERLHLTQVFDAISDGNNITRSKPDPEVFLAAAAMLGVEPENCAVVEDSEAGIIAAHRANMRAVGIGQAFNCKEADVHIMFLSELMQGLGIKKELNNEPVC